MNIGIVTYWFERGAAYVSRAYKNVLEKENTVFIYARGGEEFSKGNSNWDYDKVTWDTHYYSRIATYINLDLFRRWIAKNKIDLVIFNEQHWWLPVLLCKEMGVKTGAYIDYYTSETVPFFEAYDFLICNTKRHASVFPNHPQCIYIPWGTDLELFKPLEKPREHDYVTFFHSAGYSPDRKGTDILIEAFAKLDNASAKLIIHSQSSLAEHFPNLRDIIQRLIKAGRLELIERTITAPGVYYLGDVYVYPTKLEGIGLTIAEALSCGLPVITSNYPPMNEFITPDTGSLVKIDFLKERSDKYYWPECYCSIEDLIETMKAVVTNREDLPARKMSCRQHAIKYLDFSKNAAILNERLKSIQTLPVSTDIVDRIEQFERNRFIFIWRKRIFSPLWYLLYKVKPLLGRLLR
jgi:1,2-diacylglycerol 3-alpha-glucosyltransferase